MTPLLNINSLYHGLNTVHPLPGSSIIHLQGCRKGRTNPCLGCANADLWSDEANWMVDPGELAELVIDRATARALSISGGEPLDQYEPLCKFLKTLREENFSMLMWTGFEMLHVERNYDEVLTLLDYIVTGPYAQDKQIQNTPFVSSGNQEIHCLSSRAQRELTNYKNFREYEVVILKSASSIVCFGIDLF